MAGSWVTAVLLATASLSGALVVPTGTRFMARQARATSQVSMKIFDWQRRSDEYSEESELRLHNLRPAPGSRKRKIRKGRGMGSGKGGPCGYGMRGQLSRSGRPTRPGFEGGQTPLYRRIPKLRGKPLGPGHKKTEYGLIKLDHLNAMADNSEVTYEALLAAKAMTKVKHPLVKVVGSGELSTKGLVVKAHAFTASARQAIVDAGGECVVLPSYPVSAEAPAEASSSE